MKRIIYISILLLISISLMSVSFDESDLLYKNVWSYSGKENLYTNRKKFRAKRNGYQFKKDGNLEIRKGSRGYCGRGKLTFSNYDGDWKYLTDTTIQVYIHFFDYWEHQILKVKPIDNKYLEVSNMTDLKFQLKRYPKPFLRD